MKKILTKFIPLAYGRLFNIIVLFNPKAAAVKAFDIFCTIRKGKILPHQKDFLDSAKLALEIVGEHKVQTYQWSGTGETVLLMHGWESNTFRWRNLITKLKKHNYNIIALDAPAHGYSTGNRLHVPLYSQASRHMLDTYKPKYVVAHSVGGMTILFDHFKNQESSVEKIITIGAPCEFSQFMDHYQGLLKFNNNVREAMDIRLKEWLGFHFHEFSSARFVANNTKKGLLFHDEDDLQVPFSASKKVHEHWKGSELIATKGFGHSMHQESVNEQIIAFLKS
ncbi:MULTISPECIES: alpha/beta fold hydrolase [Croceitalea]|uniref:Alpha/beta hydrolase n=1 Tax=Croceitalea vernalis TaxID=3075599 RepID=A0ABU3BJJ6_9FLAO|nr:MULTISPECIES: alpha/beta hydrolase [unclassified Croceitalea]MDT0540486.1 alpha/beta hydrolase [Croceitalea sp. P059]MDT0622342.1 alpha/beta hydrolase [Croceitalea sp. P007]